ncbi:ribosome maturation factor RimP [Striga asiatica]|uniref:Ribosome maturation factor RimP n=1 Tax=Striga asiatica TaxID=4170 RepID=A0A5A7PVE3_STRAF|nr:ribosome maturation factor RimP [Striga asiatica]
MAMDSRAYNFSYSTTSIQQNLIAAAQRQQWWRRGHFRALSAACLLRLRGRGRSHGRKNPQYPERGCGAWSECECVCERESFALFLEMKMKVGEAKMTKRPSGFVCVEKAERRALWRPWKLQRLRREKRMKGSKHVAGWSLPHHCAFRKAAQAHT